jgi:hypothetical protein
MKFAIIGKLITNIQATEKTGSFSCIASAESRAAVKSITENRSTDVDNRKQDPSVMQHIRYRIDDIV